MISSPDDLDSLVETLFWAARGSVDDDGPSVPLNAVRDELAYQADRAGHPTQAARLRRL